GRGYASVSGPTSLRPPLFPAFVAGVWWLTDSRSLQLVRGLQDLLGIATAALTYLIARRLYDERAGVIAATLVAFYPPLILTNSLFLSETLFTFLLTAFCLAAVTLLQRPRPSIALGVGLLLGLAALTRSVLWPFPVVLVPLVLCCAPARLSTRLVCSALI